MWVIPFLLVLAVACGERGAPRTLSPPSTNLIGRSLLPSLAIGQGRFMLASGDTLFVLDRSGDPYVHVIDLRSEALIRSYGRSGEGPGDFTGPWGISRVGGAVWAFDARLDRMTRLTPDPRRPVELLELTTDGRPISAYWLTHNALLIVGEADTNRIMLADSAGTVHSMVTSPLLGADSIPFQTRVGLSSGFTTCSDPIASRFAVTFVGAGRIDIHNFTGQRVAQAKVTRPSNGDFNYDPARQRWRPVVSTRFYESCTASPSYVYALYTGRELSATEQAGSIVADSLHVFRWDGELDRTFRFDRPLITMTVVGDTSVYGVESENGTLVRFDLPRTMP